MVRGGAAATGAAAAGEQREQCNLPQVACQQKCPAAGPSPTKAPPLRSHLHVKVLHQGGVISAPPVGVRQRLVCLANCRKRRAGAAARLVGVRGERKLAELRLDLFGRCLRIEWR